jgi:hypothetical protein
MRADGHICTGRFYYDTILHLPKRIKEDHCDGNPPHGKPVAELLTGLDALAPELNLDRQIAAETIAELVGNRVGEEFNGLRKELRKQSVSSLNYLRALWTSHQALHASCPRLFTLDIDRSGNRLTRRVRKLVSGDTYSLQLYCEHSLKPVGQPYTFTRPPEWLITIAPLVRLVLPAIDALQIGLDDNARRKLRQAEEFMQKLVERSDTEEVTLRTAEPRPPMRTTASCNGS